MATVNITFRIDPELKKEAEELYDDFGMSLSNAFTMFLKQSVREQRIPFVASRLEPSDTMLAAMEEVRQMEENPALRKSYSSTDEMFEEILADG